MGCQARPGRGCRFSGPNSSAQITRPSAGGWSYRSRTRHILAMKSGSVEAFQVLVACHLIPPACRICRMLSRLMRVIPAAARYSASLVKLQVLKARPRSRGQHRAIRQTCRRACSLIVLGLPPLHFGSSAANPDSLNAWITPRTYSGEQSSRCAISGAACPCADISTTIARRSLTGSLAVRPIRRNRAPSAIVTGRTNTSGGRPIATSENSPGSSLTATPLKINYTNNVPGRGTSTVLELGPPTSEALSDHGKGLVFTDLLPALPCACSAGSGPGRCGAGDGEVPVAAREVQGRNDQEAGCPRVGVVREADDARGGCDTATGDTRDTKGVDVAVLPWVDQALQARPRGS